PLNPRSQKQPHIPQTLPPHQAVSLQNVSPAFPSFSLPSQNSIAHRTSTSWVRWWHISVRYGRRSPWVCLFQAACHAVKRSTMWANPYIMGRHPHFDHLAVKKACRICLPDCLKLAKVICISQLCPGYCKRSVSV